MFFCFPQISKLALEYKRCNGSHRDVDPRRPQRRGPSAVGPRLPGAETVSGTGPPCCNTVLLPTQWHGLSRTHNICELCVDQTSRIQPGPLVRLRCNFVDIKAAVDLFYLKEQAFFHVVSQTVSLCSNFLSSYSPFSYYTACCRTVGGDRLNLVNSGKTFFHPLEGALAPWGKSWREDPPHSIPHVEEGTGLQGSALAGLSCRTNKTLNLYLLDSNLFWRYAERLGASGSPPVKEFAAIVDLREEVHYVLGQKKALLKSSLGTAPFCPPVPLCGGGGRRNGSQVSLGKQRFLAPFLPAF